MWATRKDGGPKLKVKTSLDHLHTIIFFLFLFFGWFDQQYMKWTAFLFPGIQASSSLCIHFYQKLGYKCRCYLFIRNVWCIGLNIIFTVKLTTPSLNLATRQRDHSLIVLKVFVYTLPGFI